MGADLRLASLDKERNSSLWAKWEAAQATIDNTEPDSEERREAQEIAYQLFGLWDFTAHFRDPYNETSLSAYLGYDYHGYTAAAIAITEGREPEEGSGSYIPPQGAAMLLRHLETMEGHITGSEALGKAEDYWRLYHWGGQEGNLARLYR